MAHLYWPLFDLRVRTPTLELRYPDDATVLALVELAAKGVHDPAEMPFSIPWTDTPAGGPLERQSMQYFWRARSDWLPTKWELTFAVFSDGEPVGVQSMITREYALRRSFESGSWLGREHQGKGIGKEMRAALLHFGFESLGAQYAHTSAWHDNAASLGVTQSLGYEPNGEVMDVRRAEADRMLGFRMSRAVWESRRRADITVEGVEECLPFFGLADGW
jgi:RimJ/RimL family protein N-acetyltransferase